MKYATRNTSNEAKLTLQMDASERYIPSQNYQLIGCNIWRVAPSKLTHGNGFASIDFKKLLFFCMFSQTASTSHQDTENALSSYVKKE